MITCIIKLERERERERKREREREREDCREIYMVQKRYHFLNFFVNNFLMNNE